SQRLGDRRHRRRGRPRRGRAARTVADRPPRGDVARMNPISLRSYLTPLPLIAVLRGIVPAEVPAVAAALVDNGFRILEVPLNSPDPFASIGLLAKILGEACLTGAGTVLRPADVSRVADAGGRLIVMPHAALAIVREAKRLGLACIPGVATPTEALAALEAGADALKMFPAEQL